MLFFYLLEGPTETVSVKTGAVHLFWEGQTQNLQTFHASPMLLDVKRKERQH